MLPPGHIAAGYLTAQALLKIAHPVLSQAEQTKLLWWGMFFGFAPDLDMFIAFAHEHALTIHKPEQNNHRRYLLHAPILWLIAGLLIYFLAPSEYVKMIGLLVWLGSWSHFVLDSIEYGIMWLWPFNRTVYAIRNRGVNDTDTSKQDFFGFWTANVKRYTRKVTFYLEILIIIVSLIVYLK